MDMDLFYAKLANPRRVSKITLEEWIAAVDTLRSQSFDLAQRERQRALQTLEESKTKAFAEGVRQMRQLTLTMISKISQNGGGSHEDFGQMLHTVILHLADPVRKL